MANKKRIKVVIPTPSLNGTTKRIHPEKTFPQLRIVFTPNCTTCTPGQFLEVASVSPRILMIDNDNTGVRIRAYVLEASGYEVTTTTDPDQAKTLLREKPNAVVCSVQMKDNDGKDLLEHLHRLAPKTPVIAMIDTPYGSTPDDLVDRFVLKLDGPKALLGALSEVLRFQHHRHAEFESERVVFVDQKRRYVDVTEKACALIGYSRQELLGLQIEDISISDQSEVRQLFSQYLSDRQQEGVFLLRHKDGHPVPIRYRSRVLPDGCMAAEWEPLEKPQGHSTSDT
jgi:PAS domain S-box-containing protein